MRAARGALRASAAEDADLAALAPSTPGMVGADLRNLVNEAALSAARREHDKVKREDFPDTIRARCRGRERLDRVYELRDAGEQLEVLIDGQRAPRLCSRTPTEPVVCQPPMRRPRGAPSVGPGIDEATEELAEIVGYDLDNAASERAVAALLEELQ